MFIVFEIASHHNLDWFTVFFLLDVLSLVSYHTAFTHTSVKMLNLLSSEIRVMDD